jgi:hypothetical protein
LTIEELIDGLKNCPEVNVNITDMQRAMEIIDSN